MDKHLSVDPKTESLIEEFVSRQLATGPELLPIKRDTKLIESEILDSLSILKLVTFLEEKFGVKVAPEEVVRENFETIVTIARLVEEKKGTGGSA